MVGLVCRWDTKCFAYEPVISQTISQHTLTPCERSALTLCALWSSLMAHGCFPNHHAVRQDDIAQKIVDAAIAADRKDGLGYMEASPFDAGVRGGWRKAGPPHRQRMLRLSTAAEQGGCTRFMPDIEGFVVLQTLLLVGGSLSWRTSLSMITLRLDWFAAHAQFKVRVRLTFIVRFLQLIFSRSFRRRIHALCVLCVRVACRFQVSKRKRKKTR